jgi:predicted PurR-regulated permease PerM
MQFSATQKSVFTWLGIAMVTVLLLWLLGPVLTPFVVAGVLAYALNPVVNRLDALFRGKMPRVLGVLLVELLFVTVGAGTFVADCAYFDQANASFARADTSPV